MRCLCGECESESPRHAGFFVPFYGKVENVKHWNILNGYMLVLSLEANTEDEAKEIYASIYLDAESFAAAEDAGRVEENFRIEQTNFAGEDPSGVPFIEESESHSRIDSMSVAGLKDSEIMSQLTGGPLAAIVGRPNDPAPVPDPDIEALRVQVETAAPGAFDRLLALFKRGGGASPGQ